MPFLKHFILFSFLIFLYLNTNGQKVDMSVFEEKVNRKKGIGMGRKTQDSRNDVKPEQQKETYININSHADSICKEWYKNGQIKEEKPYKGGKIDGVQRFWYKTGQLWEESNYKDGERDGYRKILYKNGRLFNERNYKYGKLISEKKWRNDGSLWYDE